MLKLPNVDTRWRTEDFSGENCGISEVVFIDHDVLFLRH